MDYVDPDKPYPMHLPRLGHALIVNNVSKEMPGSNADVVALKTAYERVGLDVHVHADCNSQQMRSVKKFIMDDDSHRDTNCLVLTVIYHGNDKGQLLDKDKKKAWDTELFIGELSDVETLTGKPKIVIIQSCRGTQVSEGRTVPYLAEEDERETTNILPDKADMFLAYATVPGFKAHGGDHHGSVYLQALANYLQQEFMKRPLNKILQMVRQHMIRELQGKQCPEERNSLIYDVMFSEFHKRNPGASRGLGSHGVTPPPPAKYTPPQSSRKDHSTSHVQPSHIKPCSRGVSYATDFADTEPLKPHATGQSFATDFADTKSWATDFADTATDLRRERNGTGNGVEQARRTMETITIGGGGPVTMRIISTHDTDMKELDSFVVLPSRDIVLCGRVGKGPWAHHTYTQSYNKLQLKSTVKVSCKHEVHMLPIGAEDEILTSCEWCKKIKLVELRRDKTTTAFSGKDLWPGQLCDGARGQVLVYSLGKVLELSVANPSKLTGPTRTIDTGLSNCLSMCYVGPQKTVILSDGSGGVIRAVSCDSRTDEIRWEVKGIVDGKMCDPHGLAYLPHPDVLLVCDGANTRVLVLDPRNGKHRQTIDLPEEMGEIHTMWVVQNDIVMRHMVDNTFKISFISLC